MGVHFVVLRYFTMKSVSGPDLPFLVRHAYNLKFTTKNKKQTPWPESASELYRLSDRRLLAKVVQTFADIGVAWSA
jgi:hypothetical protein